MQPMLLQLIQLLLLLRARGEAGSISMVCDAPSHQSLTSRNGRRNARRHQTPRGRLRACWRTSPAAARLRNAGAPWCESQDQKRNWLTSSVWRKPRLMLLLNLDGGSPKSDGCTGGPSRGSHVAIAISALAKLAQPCKQLAARSS